MITSPGDGTVYLRSFVPVDDEFTMLMTQRGHPIHRVSDAAMKELHDYDKWADEIGGFVERTNDPRSYFLTKANKRNDYGRDLKAQAETMFCGVPFVSNLQDRAMTELMTNERGEATYDRTKEHLGSSDAMIVTVRRQLLNAATKLRDEGKVPANVDNVELDRVRAGTLRYPSGADWKKRSEEARRVDPAKAAAAEVDLIV
jgi:hypothetical protein